MGVKHNLEQIKGCIPANVKLVAVSKFHPVEAILEAYDAGQRIFGESRAQELKNKCNHLPADIEWHFIGHLQTNKVKDVVPYVTTIHSVDSWKLLYEIEKQALRQGKTVNCLLEIHIAKEESKCGFNTDSCIDFLESSDWKSLKNTRISGVMGMASNIDNESEIKREFESLKKFFVQIKKDYFYNDNYFCEISMGMSHDYPLAIEKGSTMVRIGTSIFGDR